ncbi:MAG: hypothetical protein BYD32DRAFT_436242 [Podila humilis]|nr:MAG: hypothetical protein BYD32DRAFT_436242 [Podila humilis]
MQQATVKVELGSTVEAIQFLSVLAGTKHTFDVSIKLKWTDTLPFVEKLYRDIGSTKTVALELDGFLKSALMLIEVPEDAVVTINNRCMAYEFSWIGSFDLKALVFVEELNVSYYEYTLLSYAENIVRIRLNSTTPSRLTLIKRMVDTRGRTVLQLAPRCGARLLESIIAPDPARFDANTSIWLQQPSALLGIDFLQWDCDHVFSQLFDYSAAFLDTAT